MEREPGGPQERAAQGGAEYRSNPEGPKDPLRPRAVPAAPKYRVPPAPPPKPRGAKNVSAADLTPPATRAPFEKPARNAKPVPPPPREPHPRPIKLPPAPDEPSPLATPTPPPSKWVECPYTPLTPRPAKAPALPLPAPPVPVQRKPPAPAAPPLLRGPLAAAGRTSVEPPPPPPGRHDLAVLRVGLYLCFPGLLAGHLLGIKLTIPNGGALALGGVVAGLLALGLALLISRARWMIVTGLAAAIALPVAAICVVVQVGRFKDFVVWNEHPVAAGWTTLAAAGAGLLLALGYVAEILLRRLRLPLGGWLVLLCAHAAGMVTVLNYFAWRSGESSAGGAGADAASVAAESPANLLLLAAALAALLLRAAVAATHAARWLPAWMSPLLGRARGMGPAHSGPLASPCLPVLALYALAPLAWWLAAVTLLGRWYSGQPPLADALLLAVPGALLLARLGLGAVAAFGARSAQTWAARVKDASTGGAARWYLDGRGLAAAGLLAMYAFFVAGQRVQQEALARFVQGGDAKLVEDLRAHQPPPLPAARNAVTFYRQAEGALPAMPTWYITYDEWRTPEAAEWLRKGKAARDAVAAGAALDNAEWFGDYASALDELQSNLSNFRALYDAAQLLMLGARHAGLDRDWPAVLDAARRALALARHLHRQPVLAGWAQGAAVEEIAACALLAALLWHADGPAEDDVLREAERILREHEAARGHPLAGVLRMAFLSELHEANASLAERAAAWPGAVRVPELLQAQPLPCLLAREESARWTEDLARAAESGAGVEFVRGERARRKMRAFGAPPGVNAYQLTCELTALAKLRMARVALAAAAFKRRTGWWPLDAQEALDGFGVKAPADPFRPGGAVRAGDAPPRVWCAAGRGEGFRHELPSERPDTLEAQVTGYFDSQDLVLFLDPPKPQYGYPPDPSRGGPSGAAAASLTPGQAARDLFDPESYVWKPAARALAQEGWPAWLADRELRKLAADPDPERRTWAAFIVGVMTGDGKMSAEVLEQLAADSDDVVRRFARESQRHLGIVRPKPSIWNP